MNNLIKKQILLICLFVPCQLMANGGPVTYFGVNSSGNPYFTEVADVNILREDLLIRPQGEKIFVRATYLFQSNYQHVKYAFPVDYWCSNDEDDFFYESVEIRDGNISNIKFECDGKILEYETEIPQVLDGVYSENYKMRTWFYTTFALRGGVTTLTVSYELQCEFHYQSGDLYKFARFSYDFSPAANFGNGVIKEFSMTIDLNDQTIKGDLHEAYNFEKQGELYTCNINNFDLKSAAPVEFSLSHGDSEEISILTASCYEGCYKTTVSSSTDQYPVSNMSDLDFATAYVIKEDKENKKWIEISSVNEMNIGFIRILNGYYKSEEAYYDNSRIKKALIEYITTKGNVVHTDTLTFDDDEYTSLNYTNFSQKLHYILAMDYDFFYNNRDYEYYGCADDEGNLDKSLLPFKIRMTILEEYKGRKYNDICISEMFVSMTWYWE